MLATVEELAGDRLTIPSAFSALFDCHNYPYQEATCASILLQPWKPVKHRNQLMYKEKTELSSAF